MAKQTKIDDVKKKAAPSSTSRPILVSDASEAPQDPMLATTAPGTEVPTAPQLATHTSRTIQPLDTTLQAGKDPAADSSNTEHPQPAAETPAAVLPGQAEPEVTDAEKPVESTPEPAKEQLADKKETEPQQASASDPAVVSKGISMSASRRDSEAEVNAAETAELEAQAARELELESLIASGKYTVPINSVQRKRSRIYTIVLCIVALLLAAVLADAVFDAGLVNAPSSIPHTHIFSTH